MGKQRVTNRISDFLETRAVRDVVCEGGGFLSVSQRSDDFICGCTIMYKQRGANKNCQNVLILFQLTESKLYASH